MLPAMRYKSFTFPHNPRVYAVEFKRDLAVRKAPMGTYTIQDLGRTCRVLRGEGEFYGALAYETFKKLASLFYEGSPGLLQHPVWQASQAYLAELTLRQEPREDYVAYSFVFYEGYFGQWTLTQEAAAPKGGAAGTTAATTGQTAPAQYYTVVAGDTLWAIAQRNGMDLAALLKYNPGISNPNLIYAGLKVRIR